MAIFPDIAPNYGYLWVPEYRTDRLGPTDGDYTQRRRRRSSPLYRAELTYQNIPAADERTLFEFFLARQGSYDSFVFFDFVSRVYIGEAVGTGDGSTTVFTLGARDVEDESIYFDGVKQTSGYTIGARSGGNGQDTVTFSTAPGATVAITADYTGKKYLSTCIFDSDELRSAVVSYQRHQVATFVVRQINS